MQRNSVQCFGYRIDNLKCVPICTRRSLQMSVSFLFTWQIAETLKKLLLLFSFFATFFLFFFLLYFISAFKILCLHYQLFKAYLCTALRRYSILHRLLFRSSRVNHTEQLFFSGLSYCNVLFLQMDYHFAKPLWTRDVLFPFWMREGNLGLLSWVTWKVCSWKSISSQCSCRPFHMNVSST